MPEPRQPHVRSQVVDISAGRKWKQPRLEEEVATHEVSGRSRHVGAAIAAAVVTTLAVGAIGTWAYPRARGWLELREMRSEIATYAASEDGSAGVSLYDIQDLAGRAGVFSGRALTGDCGDSPAACLGLSEEEMARALSSYRRERRQERAEPAGYGMPFPYRY